MKIFVVHTGSDKEIVESTVLKPLVACDKRAQPLIMENTVKRWKKKALQYIRQADMVLYVVSANGYNNSNIGWELEKSLLYNKMIVVYRLDPENQVHELLMNKSPYGVQSITKATVVKSIEELAAIVEQYESGSYEIFNKELEQMNSSELLEQYRLFLETSERLVERRQTVNNFYLSANTAIFTIIAAMVSLMSGMLEKMLIIILMAAVGIILDVSWSSILQSYGVLNGSKMKVISLIEKKLPILLFDSEWMVMRDKLHNRKYVSFTDSEKRIPKLFVLLYVLLSCVCAVLLINSMLA